MKCFGLNNEHDIDIQNGVVQLAEGKELTRQTAECTVNTKKGEWFLNDEMGIDFSALLGKKALQDEDAIRSAILDGLQQVDPTFTIDTFETSFDRDSRKLSVKVTASTENGNTVELSDTWG